jgi:predicted RNA-binding protein with EMAP domain
MSIGNNKNVTIRLSKKEIKTLIRWIGVAEYSAYTKEDKETLKSLLNELQALKYK